MQTDGSYRILIVDDSKAMRILLKNVILRNGITPMIFEASNGKEAFEMFPSISPDLIIMDLLMPVMDGIEATRKIHALDPTIAIIVITTSDRIQDTRDSVSSGAIDVVQKPFNPNEMSVRITKILRNKEKRIAQLYKSSTKKLVDISTKYQSSFRPTGQEKDHLNYIKKKVKGGI